MPGLLHGLFESSSRLMLALQAYYWLGSASALLLSLLSSYFSGEIYQYRARNNSILLQHGKHTEVMSQRRFHYQNNNSMGWANCVQLWQQDMMHMRNNQTLQRWGLMRDWIKRLSGWLVDRMFEIPGLVSLWLLVSGNGLIHMRSLQCPPVHFKLKLKLHWRETEHSAASGSAHMPPGKFCCNLLNIKSTTDNVTLHIHNST